MGVAVARAVKREPGGQRLAPPLIFAAPALI